MRAGGRKSSRCSTASAAGSASGPRTRSDSRADPEVAGRDLDPGGGEEPREVQALDRRVEVDLGSRGAALDDEAPRGFDAGRRHAEALDAQRAVGRPHGDLGLRLDVRPLADRRRRTAAAGAAVERGEGETVRAQLRRQVNGALAVANELRAARERTGIGENAPVAAQLHEAGEPCVHRAQPGAHRGALARERELERLAAHVVAQPQHTPAVLDDPARGLDAEPQAGGQLDEHSPVLDGGGPAEKPEQRQARAHAGLSAHQAHSVRALEDQLAQLDRRGVQAQVADRGREPALARLVGDPLAQSSLDRGACGGEAQHDDGGDPHDHGRHHRCGLPDGASHGGPPL